MTHNHYRPLMIMTALSFAAMYVLMYAMVDSFDNVYNSINQVYMAGLMAAPMVPIELWIMRRMYTDKRMNVIALAAALTIGVGCFLGIRHQAAVGDAQFLRSMIPHHAGAILMCEEAPLQDVRVRELCRSIIASQQSEIATMKGLLAPEPK